jgi:hypothetical protein
MPVSTQWSLDAASPVQRNAINSVLWMYCPASQMKGTSFLLKTGLVVTNNHGPSEAFGRLYSCGFQHDKDAPAVRTQWVTNKTSPFSSPLTLVARRPELP